MANSTQLGFQDAASPLMEELLLFHDHSLMVILLISAIVMYTLTLLMTAKLTNINMLDAQELEIVWTVLPAIVLTLVAFPSLHILYLMEETGDPHLTVKALGHQWYWSYEYTDYENFEFDSYMLPTNDLTPGQFRLLDTDHRMIVPHESPVRMLISAEDVLHSWTVPALGVKMDAVPGRLNQTAFVTSRPGVFYGQCSEICGANHSFMPIAVESAPLDNFEHWTFMLATDSLPKS